MGYRHCVSLNSIEKKIHRLPESDNAPFNKSEQQEEIIACIEDNTFLLTRKHVICGKPICLSKPLYVCATSLFKLRSSAGGCPSHFSFQVPETVVIEKKKGGVIIQVIYNQDC